MRSKSLLNILLTTGVNLCRFIVSAVFLVSGFIKVLDPIGMGYKINAYMRNWGIALSDDSVILVVLAIALSTLEFLLGIYLLLGIRRKLSTIVTMVFVVCLTIITIYINYTNAVPDCGCFGDAITLTNEQTMYKNFILLALCIPTVIFPQRMFRLISQRSQWITSIYTFVYVVAVGAYSTYYLPLIDFMPFKTGTDLKALRTNPDDKMIEIIGEKNFGEILNFAVFEGEDDVTDDILNRNNYTFLIISPKLNSADDGVADRLNDLKDYADDNGYFIYGVTASDSTAIKQWEDHTGSTYNFLLGQDEQLKSIVRSNPGLVLLKEGRILNKWSKNTIPANVSNIIKAQEKATMPEDIKTIILKLALWFFVPLFLIIFADVLWNGVKRLYEHNVNRQINNSIKK